MLAGVFVEVDIMLAPLAILLIALMGGILRSVALLSLFSGIFDMAAAFLDLVRIAGFGVTGALVALIIRRHGRGLGHYQLRCCFQRDNAR
jgi:hypothetical protein